MKNVALQLSAVCASALVFLVLAQGASADTRVGNGTDPQDVTAALSGGFVGDLQELDVSYDTSGSLMVTVRFYQLIPDTGPSGYYVVVHIDGGSSCAPMVTVGNYATTGKVTAITGPSVEISVSGYQGADYIPQTISSDGYGVSYSYTNSAIAGLDLRCADAEVFTSAGPSATLVDTLGPFNFDGFAPSLPPTKPPAQSDVYQVSPADGATTSATPTLSYHLPAGVSDDVYISSSPFQLSNGSPAGTAWAHCTGATTAATTYTCSVPRSANLVPGLTYYWWLVVTDNGSSWHYPARSFTVASAPAGASTGGSGNTSGGAKPSVHGLSYAPYLHSSTHYKGRSIKQTRLSKAAYALSKFVGYPKTVAVACWSTADWENISGDNPESSYTVLGFWTPTMPRWLQLSPTICHTIETLLYKRPKFPNRYTANAVDTLTHEMIHALGIRNEAQTECYAMQLSWVTAESLGVPAKYSYSLSRLTLANYGYHPPRYINRSACREDGAWDLFKGRPSLPWHNFQL